MALSTAEAEYTALASAAQEAICSQHLISHLNENLVEPIVIYQGNLSAMCMAKNPQYHGRTKHVNIKFHLIRNQMATRAIQLQYFPSKDMVADVLTKGLTCEEFVKLKELPTVKTLFLFSYRTASEKE